MNREFAGKWLNKLREYWFNKDIEKAVSLFAKTSFYQETPFMKPYTNIQEIKFEILAIDNNVLIAEWFLKQNDQEFDGIYEIKFNDKFECVYFKSWEMTK